MERLSDRRQIAQQHGRMVEVSILAGERSKAYAAVDRAFDMIEESSVDRLRDSDDVRRIASERIAAILNAGGIYTIGDLRKHSRESLVQVHQIRYRSADILGYELARYGLSLKKSEEC